MSDVLYSLYLRRPEQFQIPLLSKALMAIRKIPLADASMIAKKSWGLLEMRLTEDSAKNLQTQYQEQGVDTFFIEESKVTLPQADRLKKILPSEYGLEALSERQNYGGLLWRNLKLIAVLGREEKSSYTVRVETGPSAAQKAASMGILLTTGIPISIGPKKSVKDEKRETHEIIFSMDLFFSEPWVRLTIQALSFDYSFLKERKEFNGMNNFRLLLSDLVAAAPQAKFNKGATLLVQRQPINQMGYEGQHDFDRECGWMWALISFGVSL